MFSQKSSTMRVVLGGDRARRVRADEHVRQIPERALGRQRLLLEDVERGAAQPPGAQRVDERRLVDDVAARDVDDDRGRLAAARGGARRAGGASSGVCGTARTTASASGSSSSSWSVGTSRSTCELRGGAAAHVANGADDVRMSSARASRATSRPILPRPTTHTILPAVSSPA